MVCFSVREKEDKRKIKASYSMAVHSFDERFIVANRVHVNIFKQTQREDIRGALRSR